MRTAPAVTVEVTPDPVWRAGLMLIVALTAVSLPAWWASHGTLGDRFDVGSWLGMAVVCIAWLCALRATWRLRTPPCHALRWTGLTWQTLDARRQARSVTLSVAIDTGGWMLLQVQDESAEPEAPAHPLARWVRIGTDLTGRSKRWIALSERRLPHTWHALRCAVHGQPTAPEPAAELGAQP